MKKRTMPFTTSHFFTRYDFFIKKTGRYTNQGCIVTWISRPRILIIFDCLKHEFAGIAVLKGVLFRIELIIETSF